jgi:dienelactone hydrolase
MSTIQGKPFSRWSAARSGDRWASVDVSWHYAATWRRRSVPGAKLGTVGFCFGGGMAWNLHTSPRYNEQAAKGAYAATLDWFRAYLS